MTGRPPAASPIAHPSPLGLQTYTKNVILLPSAQKKSRLRMNADGKLVEKLFGLSLRTTVWREYLVRPLANAGCGSGRKHRPRPPEPRSMTRRALPMSVHQMFFAIVPPSGLALVVCKINHNVGLALVVHEKQLLFRLALVFHKKPKPLVVLGLALVLAFVDDQIRLGLVFGDMDFHVRLAFVLT